MNDVHRSSATQTTGQKEESVDLHNRLGGLGVGTLNLPRRYIHAMGRAGILTIDDLIPLNEHDLFLIPGISKQGAQEIQNSLQQALRAPGDHFKAFMELQKRAAGTWAEVLEPFLHAEKERRIQVLLSRFGFQKKTLERLAAETGVSREAIRQVEWRAARRLVKYIVSRDCLFLSEQTAKLLAERQEDRSLPLFRAALLESGILGRFLTPPVFEWGEADLFEFLVAYLSVLSDPRFATPLLIVPVDVRGFQHNPPAEPEASAAESSEPA